MAKQYSFAQLQLVKSEAIKNAYYLEVLTQKENEIVFSNLELRLGPYDRDQLKVIADYILDKIEDPLIIDPADCYINKK